MILKLLKVLPWVAIGYVLGARAGRERYEQIATTAQKVAGSAPVQAGVAKAAEQAPVVAGAVREKASTAAHAAADKMPFGHGGDAADPLAGSGTRTGAGAVATPDPQAPAGPGQSGPGQHRATDAGSNGTGS